MKNRKVYSPKPGVHSLPGPEDILRAELPNGIVVLARSNFNSPSVVIQGYLTAGSLFDTDDKLGLADFTASGLMRGTLNHDFQSIYDSLESVGASLSFNSGTHTAGFSGRSLVEDLDMLLSILVETLTQPAFPSGQVERLRAQLLTGLAIRAQETSEMASLTFDQIIYTGHPYGRPDDGYPETVQAITREDLANFHRIHYGPQGMVISVVGAVEPQAAYEKVAQALGSWENPRQPAPPHLPPVLVLQNEIRRKATIPGKIQSDIMLGIAGPARSSPDFIAAAVGNSILGQFGMYGRIGDVVREQAGLAYYAYSNVSGGIGPGPWYITAGVNPINVEKAIELSIAEIKRFVGEPVTTEELNDSKANYIGRLPLTLESNSGVAGALLNLERFQLGLDYYQRYPSLINAVTPDAIQETAGRYLDPGRLGIAVAGP